MEVINTIETGFDAFTIFLLILLSIISLLFLFVVIVSRDIEFGSLLMFVITASLIVGICVESSKPRYEVILTDPDYVIDAREYEIVGQRGDIYVIRPRNER